MRTLPVPLPSAWTAPVRSAPAWPRLVVALALAAPLVGGCAARVSRSGPSAAPPSAAIAPASSGASASTGAKARGSKAPRPAAAVVARPAESPAPAPEAKPVAVTWVTTSPSSLPAGDTDEAPSAPPVKVAAPAATPATPKKKSYHAYSDGELGALRKKSRAFKKLDDELRGCTKRSETAIERREAIPTEIARIRMSKGGLDAAKERKIAALNAELEQLRAARGAEDCAPLEAEATAMLEEHYRADDAIY